MRATPIVAVVCMTIIASGRARPEKPSVAVDFNRQVRPILAGSCFKCHGPDAAARQARLRLDTAEGAAMLRRDGRAAVVAGDATASLLLERVTTLDDSFRMPPPGVGPRLSAEQIDVLRRWIEEGAEYQRHWSFVPPQRPQLPLVDDPDWPRHVLDAFVLARLDGVGIAPSPAADSRTVAPTPTSGWSTSCSRRPTTASTGRRCGSISPGTPTPRATRRTVGARCGRTATGSSVRSTTTCPSTGSPSSSSPAT
jgi:hypothetical protein